MGGLLNDDHLALVIYREKDYNGGDHGCGHGAVHRSLRLNANPLHIF